MAVRSRSNPISSIEPDSSPISSVPEYSHAPQYNYNSSGSPTSSSSYQQAITHLNLELRGQFFKVELDALTSLPESVLLHLFPNGPDLGLMAGRGNGNSNGPGQENVRDVFGLDYDPAAFSYMLNFWLSAHHQFYGTPSFHPSIHSSIPTTSPPGIGGLYHLQRMLLPREVIGGSGNMPYGNNGMGMGQQESNGNPLTTRQPIIVLREELEYFTILPSSKPLASSVIDRSPATLQLGDPVSFPQTNIKGEASPQLLNVRRLAGEELLKRDMVFTALQRNVSKEGNMAEQHLIDMLCMSGFNRDDAWGYRSVEPNRCCISSIALVLLRTGITHHPPASSPFHSSNSNSTSSTSPSDSATTPAAEPTPFNALDFTTIPSSTQETLSKMSEEEAEKEMEKWEINVDGNQMGTAQKLLLFWRKPARKCWWDGVLVDIPSEQDPTQTISVKVWARRVWTLELSLI